MKKLAIVAVVVVIGAQLMALPHPDRHVVAWIGAATAAAVLLVVRWFLVRDDRPVGDDSRARDPSESLRRWRSKTEILIARADTTRSDWDKYLRPVLARQFELATGRRKGKDPRVFHATALALFGERLWPWVDPDNVSPTGGDEPGPGRAVLDEVLRRLEMT
ncbi:hypothetical protein [Mycolicibacterium sp. 050158]|uniref:hypothetical protein n=1 Tax=Mycolicibacterium sp. 050158 TaxID=3090602 RepID=UPI00299DD083|nr:hypothetical protein [Mycolicibacterium sp. 050158]MDX1889431.1 hypothetical protein [Mycolicibacterium sp. 050158]